MERYSILIQHDGSQWIATVPEFGPVPRGYGDTREEALREIEIALVEKIKAYARAGVALPAANTI